MCGIHPKRWIELSFLKSDEVTRLDVRQPLDILHSLLQRVQYQLHTDIARPIFSKVLTVLFWKETLHTVESRHAAKVKEEARILYTFSQIQIVYIWPFALCLLRLGTLLYALYGKHSSVLCAQAENFAVPDLSAKICFHALFYSIPMNNNCQKLIFEKLHKILPFEKNIYFRDPQTHSITNCRQSKIALSHYSSVTDDNHT